MACRRLASGDSNPEPAGDRLRLSELQLLRQVAGNNPGADGRSSRESPAAAILRLRLVHEWLRQLFVRMSCTWTSFSAGRGFRAMAASLDCLDSIATRWGGIVRAPLRCWSGACSRVLLLVDGGERGGHQDAILLTFDERVHLGQEHWPARVGGHRRTSPLPVGEVLVTPH